ncbi:MAG: hypothetical protein SFW08_02700 [Gemmatimonadaceae bacterium]|nr:hypothetical protein [Gemmatimonadaceae bacterium]
MPLLSRPLRRSAAIRLTFLHGLVVGVAGCSDAAITPDPCEPELYDPVTCQRAVANGGYFYRGSWVPRAYPHPFLYYGSTHDAYVARGGRAYAAPASAYAAPYRGPDARAADVVGAVTPEGTRLSAARMSAIGRAGGSFAAARSGPTASRGGFGSTGTRGVVRGG